MNHRLIPDAHRPIAEKIESQERISDADAMALYQSSDLNRIFKSVGIALPGSEGAELTRKNADVGVVDITVMNVAGIIAVLSLAHEIGHHPQRIEIAGLM